MKKNVNKSQNIYGKYRPNDSACLNKIDENLSKYQNNHNKNAIDFFENAKTFVLNAIETKNKALIKVYDKLPKRMKELVEDRNIEGLYNAYNKDVKIVGKALFSEEMSLEEIYACAMEYVRLCSSNFDTFESEGTRSEESLLAEKLCTSYGGILSFYLGLANDEDRTQLLAKLINVGIDIKKSISYAECITDSYGKPVCQIVNFSQKSILCIFAYNGVYNSYTNNVGKLNSVYNIVDFSKCIESAKNKAMQVFFKFHDLDIISQEKGEITNIIEPLCRKLNKYLSHLSASEYNPLIEYNKKIFKLSVVLEMYFYKNKIEYELIADIFNPLLNSYKLTIPNYSRVKVFPNKIYNLEYELEDKPNYLIAKKENVDSFENNIDKEMSADVDNAEDYILDFDEFEQKLKEEEKKIIDELESVPQSASFTQNKTNIFDEIDKIKPIPAKELAQKLQVKFMAEDENEYALDGSRLDQSEKYFDSLLNAVEDYSNAHNVDEEEAEKERLMYEKELGITSEKKKDDKKSFYDMLNELDKEYEKKPSSKLQDKFDEIEKNNHLNNKVKNSSNKNESIDNSSEKVKNSEKSSLNDNNSAKNDSIVDNFNNYTDKKIINDDNKKFDIDNIKEKSQDNISNSQDENNDKVRYTQESNANNLNAKVIKIDNEDEVDYQESKVFNFDEGFDIDTYLLNNIDEDKVDIQKDLVINGAKEEYGLDETKEENQNVITDNNEVKQSNFEAENEINQQNENKTSIIVDKDNTLKEDDQTLDNDYSEVDYDKSFLNDLAKLEDVNIEEILGNTNEDSPINKNEFDNKRSIPARKELHNENKEINKNSSNVHLTIDIKNDEIKLGKENQENVVDTDTQKTSNFAKNKNIDNTVNSNIKIPKFPPRPQNNKKIPVLPKRKV